LAKVNPLFQDSSISKGTNIRTQFELKKVFLNADEKIFLSVLDRSERKIVELKRIDEKSGTYSASLWLKHKQEITYYFFLMESDKVVQVSDIKSGIAMYTLMEIWTPSSEPEKLAEVDSDLKASPESAHVLEPQEIEKPSPEVVIENLIEKWGL
jgi:hypothetical protein